MRVRGVDLRGGVSRRVVSHPSALRSSVREVEAMDVAVEVSVWVGVCVVFVGCWGSTGGPCMDLTVRAGSMGFHGSCVRFIDAVATTHAGGE